MKLILYKRILLPTTFLILFLIIYKQFPSTVKVGKRFRISFVTALVLLFEPINLSEFNKNFAQNSSLEVVLNVRSGELHGNGSHSGIFGKNHSISDTNAIQSTSGRTSRWGNLRRLIRSSTTAHLADPYYRQNSRGPASVTVIDSEVVKDGRFITSNKTVKNDNKPVCGNDEIRQICLINEEVKDSTAILQEPKEKTKTEKKPEQSASNDPEIDVVVFQENTGSLNRDDSWGASSSSDDDSEERKHLQAQLEKLRKKLDDEFEIYDDLIDDLEFFMKDSKDRIEKIYYDELSHFGIDKNIDFEELEKIPEGQKILSELDRRDTIRKDKINQKIQEAKQQEKFLEKIQTAIDKKEFQLDSLDD